MIDIRQKNETVEEIVNLIIDQTDLVYGTNVDNEDMIKLKENIADIIICNMSEFMEKEIDKFKKNIINVLNIQ